VFDADKREQLKQELSNNKDNEQRNTTTSAETPDAANSIRGGQTDSADRGQGVQPDASRGNAQQTEQRSQSGITSQEIPLTPTTLSQKAEDLANRYEADKSLINNSEFVKEVRDYLDYANEIDPRYITGAIETANWEAYPDGGGKIINFIRDFVVPYALEKQYIRKTRSKKTPYEVLLEEKTKEPLTQEADMQELQERYKAIINELVALPEGEQRNSRYQEVKDELAELEQQITGTENLEEIKARQARLKEISDKFDREYAQNNVVVNPNSHIHISLRKDENGKWISSDRLDDEFSLYRFPDTNTVVVYPNYGETFYQVDENKNITELTRSEFSELQKKHYGTETEQETAGTQESTSLTPTQQKQLDDHVAEYDKKVATAQSELKTANKNLGDAARKIIREQNLFGDDGAVLNELEQGQTNRTAEHGNKVLDAYRAAKNKAEKAYNDLVNGREKFIEDTKRQLQAQSEIRFQITSNPRGVLTKPRGKIWTKEKIIKQLKKLKKDGTNSSKKNMIRFLSKFNSPDELREVLFYHGTGNYVDGGLYPSIT
jgi:hypothetical protein